MEELFDEGFPGGKVAGVMGGEAGDEGPDQGGADGFGLGGLEFLDLGADDGLLGRGREHEACEERENETK